MLKLPTYSGFHDLFLKHQRRKAARTAEMFGVLAQLFVGIMSTEQPVFLDKNNLPKSKF